MSKKYFGQTNNSAEAVVPQADKLATPRDITLAGDVTGGITFDGASNETITTVLDVEKFAMPKSVFDANAEQRIRENNGSGFSEFGKHNLPSSFPNINEGLWEISSSPNDLRLGRGTSAYGTSRTEAAIVVVGGVSHKLYGINSNDPSFNPVKILTPEAEAGTRSYDDVAGVAIDYLTDVDPKYGDVAGDLSEAVSRNFEGLIKNGDFRNGTTSWNNSLTSVTVVDGVATLVADSTAWGNIGQTILSAIKPVNGDVVVLSAYVHRSDCTFSLRTDNEAAEVIVHPAGTTGYIQITATIVDDALVAPAIVLHSTDGVSVVEVSQVSMRKIENQPILSRQDYGFLETFHQKVSDTDLFCPLGLPQYGNSTSEEDIPLTLITSLGVAQGYSAFGDWDTTTVGYAAKWSTMTVAQQKTALDNPENNLYYDAETAELIQVRARVRVIRGVQNQWKSAVPWKDTDGQFNYINLSAGNGYGVGVRGISETNSDISTGSNLFGSPHATVGWGLDKSDPTIYTGVGATAVARSYNKKCYALPLVLIQK